MEIYLPNLREGYHDLVSIVNRRGTLVDVRGLTTSELIGVTIKFVDPEQPLLPVGVGRGVNTTLAALEALSLISGEPVGHLIRAVAPGYADVMVDPADLEYGAYGPRVATQLADLVEHLRVDPTSRRAVLSIWRPDDLTHPGDRPCTLTIQFLARGAFLDMIVNMRSQDVWLGAAMDMFVFGQLRDTVAYVLDLVPGRYIHHIGSLHLYDRDRSRLRSMFYTQVDAEVDALPHGVRPRRFESFESIRDWQEVRSAAASLVRLAEGGSTERRSLVPDWREFHTNSHVGRNDWYLTRVANAHERVQIAATGGSS